MRPLPRTDCGFNQVAPLQLTPSSALEHAENADTLWDRISLRIGELPLDPLENKIGTWQTLAVFPQWRGKRTLTQPRLTAAVDPKDTLKRIWKLLAGLGVGFQKARCFGKNRSWLSAGWSNRPRILQNTRHCLLLNAEGSNQGRLPR
jgi:hypothetical protein